MSVEWSGDAFLNTVNAATTSALFAGAELIKDQAQRLVPFMDGDLKESIIAEADGKQAVVFSDSPYAARQHEEVGWVHPKGGQAKYLETAVNSMGDTAMALVAARIRAAGGG